MTSEANSPGGLITRRTALSSGALCALACLMPRRALNAITMSSNVLARTVIPNRVFGGAELYVFSGTRRERVVIALTWPLVSHGGFDSVSEVRIHSRTRTWDVKAWQSPSEASTWNEKGCRMFSGRVISEGSSTGTVLNAVVVEGPSEIAGRDRSEGVWAERFTQDGTRQRIGSPFLAEILTGDRDLRELYHRVSPAEDIRLLTEPVAAAISANARRRRNIVDSEAHGWRLADMLLPDVLSYAPDRPSGFTFAGQNGRHPQEASGPVVHTILTGESSCASANPIFRLEDDFPYFSRPSRPA